MAFKKGGTLYYPLQDHLKGTAIIANSAGSVVESTTYYPYGQTRTGGITATDRQFTGERLDGTGLYFYNARYYDPQIGRFISADTVVQSYRNPGYLNRYTYTLNNPLKHIDPSGHRLIWSEDETRGYWYWVADEPQPSPAAPAPVVENVPPPAPAQPEAAVIIVAVGTATATALLAPEVVGVAAAVALGIGAIYVGREIGKAIGNAISQASSGDASKPNQEADGGAVQKGGKTVKDSTAKELNKYNGENRTAREWGRALEDLKDYSHIPRGEHGTIKRNGDYYDSKGNYRGNLNDHLP